MNYARWIACLAVALVLAASVLAQDTKKKKTPTPCADNANARQFDFWVGQWKVMANGKTAGHNVISERHNGCLIHESYTTPSGYSGESVNFFDPSTQSWRQIWIDNTGNVIWYEGELVDGEMRFLGDLHAPNGKTQKSRMTFTPNEDGSVRQLMEQSSDGADWKTVFDGLYVQGEEGAR